MEAHVPAKCLCALELPPRIPWPVLMWPPWSLSDKGKDKIIQQCPLNAKDSHNACHF